MCTMLEAMAKAFDEETMYGLEESVCADVEALRLYSYLLFYSMLIR